MGRILLGGALRRAGSEPDPDSLPGGSGMSGVGVVANVAHHSDVYALGRSKLVAGLKRGFGGLCLGPLGILGNRWGSADGGWLLTDGGWRFAVTAA